MSEEKLEQKILLSIEAATLYEENEGEFTVAELALRTGIEQNTIYDLFSNKRSILKYYYNTVILRYRFMIDEIEDFESYTLSEKLSNFMFTSFDLFSEHHDFVKKTFKSYHLDPFDKQTFENEIEELLQLFIGQDPNISFSAAIVTRGYFYTLLKQKYLALVYYWLNDESEHKERTFALVDKFNSFIQELLYNKVIDKGFDLTKYAFTTGGILEQIPVIGDLFKDCNKDKDQDSD